MTDCDSAAPPGFPVVCGTGRDLNTGFKPGDPTTNYASIWANATVIGVEVGWQYPASGGEAIAHSILYRGQSNIFSAASILVSAAAGSTYLDINVVDGTGYYYWVSMVTINGTIGPPIGPAFAIFGGTMAQIFDAWEDYWFNHPFYLFLSERIDTITDLSSGLSSEMQNRLLGDDILTQLIQQLNIELGAIDTYYQNTFQEYQDDYEAWVLKTNILIAQFNTYRAEYLNTVEVLTDKDQALAVSIEYLRTQTATDIAAAVAVESFVRSTQDSAIAGRITTVESKVNGNTASIQTQAIVIDGLDAQYSVKLDVNGNVVGFGLWNQGPGSNGFMVVASQFAIISSSGNNRAVPFFTDNGKTYIADAFIKSASIGTLKVANEAIVASDVFVGVNTASGSFNPEGGKIFATVTVQAARNSDARGWVYLDIGGVTRQQEFYQRVADGTINFILPITVSSVGAAGANWPISISAWTSGGSISWSNMILSVSSYKR